MLNTISKYCSNNQYCNVVKSTISEHPEAAIITSLLAVSSIALFYYASSSHTLQNREVKVLTGKKEEVIETPEDIKNRLGRITMHDIPLFNSIKHSTIEKHANSAIENKTSLTFGNESSASDLNFLKLDFPCFVSLMSKKKVDEETEEKIILDFHSAIGALLATKFNDNDLLNAFKDVNEKSGLAIVEQNKQVINKDWSNSKLHFLKFILNHKFLLGINNQFIIALLFTNKAHLKFEGTSADFPNNEIGEALMEIRGEFATRIMNEDNYYHKLKSLAKDAAGIVPDPESDKSEQL